MHEFLMTFLFESFGETICYIVLCIDTQQIDLLSEDRVFDEEPTHIKPSCTVLTRALSHEKLGVDIVCQDNNTTPLRITHYQRHASCSPGLPIPKGNNGALHYRWKDTGHNLLGVRRRFSWRLARCKINRSSNLVLWRSSYQMVCEKANHHGAILHCSRMVRVGQTGARCSILARESIKAPQDVSTLLKEFYVGTDKTGVEVNIP